MDNLFEGGIAELNQIKAAIEEEAHKAMELDIARDALRAKEKEVEEENALIEDRIKEVLKSKRDAVFEPYNKEVEKASLDLKDSMKRREAAKEIAVNRRISNETSSISEQNAQLDFSTKTLFKTAGMPAFCRKRYFYSMFAPKSPRDFVTFIITAIIALVVIPLLVMLLVDTTTVGKIFIYVGIVAFFCLIYLAIFFWTQPNKNRKTMELARPDVKQIAVNKKELRKRTKDIRSDKDESGYGLEELDNEIVRNRGLYDDAVAKREEALKAFEEESTEQVRNEVKEARAAEMEKLTGEIEVLKTEFAAKEAAAKAAEQNLTRNYGSYIGKRNMNPERIDQLIGIIREGKATNIIGALDVQKEEGKITNRLSEAAEKIKPAEEAAEEKKSEEVIRTDFSTIYEEDARNRTAKIPVEEVAAETQNAETGEDA